jgi:hypothetical protein
MKDSKMSGILIRFNEGAEFKLFSRAFWLLGLELIAEGGILSVLISALRTTETIRCCQGTK